MSKKKTAETIETSDVEASNTTEPTNNSKAKKPPQLSLTFDSEDDKKVFHELLNELKSNKELLELSGTKQGSLLASYLKSKSTHKNNQVTSQSSVIDNQILEQTEEWFTKVSGKTPEERNSKQSEVKAVLGFEPNQPVLMTRKELYEKAAKLAGKTIDTVIIEGADTNAQTLITTYRKPASETNGGGQGRAGSKDAALAKTLLEVLEMVENGSYKPRNGTISLTQVANRSMTGYPTALNWAKRNGLNKDISPEEARNWLKQNNILN
jgi:hypothetical protein